MKSIPEIVAENESAHRRAMGLIRKPSKEFLRLNPVRATPRTQGENRAAPVNPGGSGGKATRKMAGPSLNKTEQRWQAAHPSHIPFPLRLRWGNCMNYSPDFMDKFNGSHSGKTTLIEIKGGHIYERDRVRFKGCAAEWGWLFEFQLWQWKDRQWTRLY